MRNCHNFKVIRPKADSESILLITVDGERPSDAKLSIQIKRLLVYVWLMIFLTANNRRIAYYYMIILTPIINICDEENIKFSEFGSENQSNRLEILFYNFFFFNCFYLFFLDYRNYPRYRGLLPPTRKVFVKFDRFLYFGAHNH